VQPGSDRIAHPERPGFADQDKKRHLERVVGIVSVAREGAADPQHHRAVPLDERRERKLRRLTRSGDRLLQKLPIGQPGEASDIEQRRQMPSRGATLNGNFSEPFERVSPRPSTSIMPRAGTIVPFF
jgi:hypothetical protein